LFSLCWRLKPAIIHSRNLSGLDVLLPARLAGVRYCIHSEHGRDMDDLQGNNRKLALLRRLHRPFINHYITVSKDLQRYLVDQVGVAAEKITQIYNGVDTDRFFPASGNLRGILPKAFQDHGKIIIGTVGRLQTVKNQASLMYAFADMLKQHPEWRHHVYLAIIGSGPLFEELQALAAVLGISENMWLPGRADNIADILKSFDVFVLPSLAEGISNTILEAMATGLPVIATAVGGNVELLADGHNGRLFKSGDTDALRDLISDYVINIDQRKQHGNNARQTVVSHFSMNTMMLQYQTIYEAGLV
jgi:sugar transferase (PEP-CTERM/EpsH1 system associated)